MISLRTNVYFESTKARRRARDIFKDHYVHFESTRTKIKTRDEFTHHCSLVKYTLIKFMKKCITKYSI